MSKQSLKINYNRALTDVDVANAKDDAIKLLDRIDQKSAERKAADAVFKVDLKELETQLTIARRSIETGTEEVTEVPVTAIFYSKTNERRYYDARKGEDTGKLLRIDKIKGDVQLDIEDIVENGPIPAGEKSAKDLKGVHIVKIDLEELPL